MSSWVVVAGPGHGPGWSVSGSAGCEFGVGITDSFRDVSVDVCVVRLEACTARRVLSHLLHEPGPTQGGVYPAGLGDTVLLEVAALWAAHNVFILVKARLAYPHLAQ